MTENIQVRMKEFTIEKIDNIKNIVNAPSRSDVIRRAIDITEILVNAIEAGNEIIIKCKGGKQKQILLSGLNFK